MRYRLLFVFLLFFISLVITFGLSKQTREAFFKVTDTIKIHYLEISQSLWQNYDRFLNQAKSIAFYQEKYKQYQQIELELTETKEQLKQILDFYPQLDLYSNTAFQPALVISYVDFLQYDKVWLNTKMPYQKDKIFGIIRNGYALGIAVVENDRLLGLFNGNERCSYSVYIGEKKIPATLHYYAEKKDLVLADFIPQYFNINIGDEVFTSGLDNIFIQNIPVGKVIEILDKNGYITAVVKPYADATFPEYVWLVNKDYNNARK